MSWIFAYINKNSTQRKINFDFQNQIYSYKSDSLFISAGGNPKTCVSGINNSKNNGFIVAGIGLNFSGNNNLIYTSNDWEQKLNNNFNPNSIDGHYVIFKWDADEIKVYTDVLGLRDIYFYQNDNEIILSTKPEWLKEFTNLEIDFNVFGSRWLLFNQISTQSIFKGITRICCGDSLTINRNNNESKITHHHFEPENNSHYDFKSFSQTLDEIVLFPLNNFNSSFTNSSELKNDKLSLSLSGGMDSRVLLSVLLGSGKKGWDTHTLGNENHPDNRIVNKIVTALDFKNNTLNFPLPERDILINELQKYSISTLACKPASEIVQALNYIGLKNKYDIIIDGGFGEIWRREYFNRLFVRGGHALYDKNPAGIYPHLVINNGSIFSHDIIKLMETGCIEQLEQIIKLLPDIQDFGAGNWLDLFAIKTKLPNVYGHEQTRQDSIVTSFMPYIQPTLLKMIFSIDEKQKKNGGIFRKIIDKHFNKLSKFPLTKGTCLYPYFLSTMQMRLWTTLVNRTGLEYKDNQRIIFLDYLSEFVLDKVSSQKVRENPVYNYDRIKYITNDFKNGNHQHAQELDRFLSYDMMIDNFL